MTAQAFADAHAAGRAAALRGEPVTANPYAPRTAPGFRDPAPRPRTLNLAAAWLEGWRKQSGSREAVIPDDLTDNDRPAPG